MAYRYATKAEKSAKAVGTSLPISTKSAIEICAMVRGKKVETATRMLEEVIDHKRAVPFKRFAHGGTGHRKKIGPGRYPEKACGHVLNIINSAVANAQVKGLSSLILHGISAHKAPKARHYGRHRGTEMKRTHIEVVLAEMKAKEAPKND